MIYPDPKYFDYSATSPPYVEALDRLKDVSLQYFGNPSSSHKKGTEAKSLLLSLKEEFCNLLNFTDGRLLLCSSGTEANNTIIEGHLKANPDGKILLAENVHDSMWYATDKFKSSTDVVKINKNGIVDLDSLKDKLDQSITLVCINHVCNETGAIQNLQQISGICSVRNIKLLADGVQALGHIPVAMDTISADYYSFSAHKFGGPRAFGGILIRDDSFEPLLFGGKQEWSLRAGTENPAGLAAAVVSLALSIKTIDDEILRLNDLKKTLISKLRISIPGMIINSHEDGKPGFVSLSFPGFAGNEILSALSVEGYAVSTGSACHNNLVTPSRIIMALGRTPDEAKGTVRISMGRGTTLQSLENLSDTLIDIVKNR
jgi:cysteine desulfurase